MDRTFDNELISVIIPIYNSKTYLKQTIDSVLNQDYDKDFNIILVDDCSKDNPEEIINLYKDEDRVIYIKLEENVGAGEARNIGLKFSAARFVAFLDSDDLWKKEKLKKQMLLMKEKNALLSYTAIDMIDSTGSLIKSKRKVPKKASYKTILKNTLIANSSVIVDRAVAGDFLISTRRMSQDYSTWLRLLRGGSLAYGIDEALVSYRVHNASLSFDKRSSLKYIWDIQREDEKLPAPVVFFNLICWSFNSFIKHFL